MVETEILDELFCQKLETKALADFFCYRGCERWLYGYMLEQVEDEHLRRYQFASELVKDKVVLDVASGCGYGSYLMALDGKAKKVFGLDIDQDAIRYSEHRYSLENIQRSVGDATEYKFEAEYDVITSFETVEHIPNYEKYLQNMESALSEDGFLLISTPIVKNTSTKPDNPHHVIEWNYADFKKLMSRYFIVKDVYFQNIVLSSDTMKPTILNRILRKLGLKKLNNRIKVPFEKYNKQYNLNEVKSGFQMFVCTKKTQ